MITVIKKPLTPNIVWDAETSKPLCKFSKGVFQTNDKVIADKLAALGYKITGEVDGEGNETPDESESNNEGNEIPALDDKKQNTEDEPKTDKVTTGRSRKAEK